MGQASRRLVASSGTRSRSSTRGEPERAVQPLLELQRTAGNRATAGFVVQRAASSKADAVAAVPAHVEPKPCFVWYTGNARGWTPIPGTGCAHWIAHQLGLGAG